DWTLLLNGDLLPAHLNFAQASSRLGSFVTTLQQSGNGQIVVVPGDRDWDKNGEFGLDKIKLLEEFFRKQQIPNVYFPLRKGCPGPVLLPIADKLAFLTLNTQWINHPFEKPRSESAKCDLASEESILEEIESLLEDHADKNILIAGHHPVISNGIYGGIYPADKWLFPIPGISAFFTAYHKNIGGPLDLANKRLAPFLEALRGLLSDQFSLIYAAGHEKNLEILKDYDNIHINSGAPTKGAYVASRKNTIYRSSEPGIIAIRYYTNGLVQAIVYKLEQQHFIPRDSIKLFQAPCLLPAPQLSVNHRLVPCISEVKATRSESLARPQSIEIAANPNYTASKSKARWLGQHYRHSWTTKITAPVLDLDTYQGGLLPLEVGGGRQTLSLKFRANNGLEYVFRSVDKDPSKALARDLRSTIISLLIRDQTTTQQPYGALAISPLLDQLDILHARPQLFVMPNDTRLGPYLSTYGGMLGMIEDRPVDPKDSKSFAQADDIKRSINLFKAMYRDRDVQVNVDDFVRARVFDLWVGDWGKHEDNWKWAGYKTGKSITYRPIPRDRDHVFSSWDGIIPWLVDRAWAKPSGEHFGYRIKGLRSLMWQARHLDRFIASPAERSDWLDAARLIKNQITNIDIDSAVLKMPRPVALADGVEISKKLKARLNDLPEYALKYYALLAKEVDIVGSNKREHFIVDRLQDGDLKVSMYKIKNDQRSDLYYERLFKYPETEEIRLFGLEGHDSITIRGVADKSILIRLIPGEDSDVIIDSSTVKTGKRKTLLYDQDRTDQVTNASTIRKINNADPSAYHYRRTAFHYNTYFPLVYLSFSSDYGISVNGSVNFTNHKYGVKPYAASHDIGASISSIGNIKVTYDGEWTKALRPFDLVAGTSLEKRRRYRYFIGLGNETVFDRDLLLDDYYTLQYTSAKAYLGLQNTFWKRSSLRSYLQFEYNSRQTLENNVFSELELVGAQALKIGKIVVDLDLDFRDRENLPNQGARFFASQQISKVATEALRTYFVGQAGLEYFLTVKPFTLGVRSGAMYSHNEVPYYDRPTLGQNQFLRGFRRNRFTGDGALYLNTDLRLELSDKMASLIPHKYGLRFFYDQGKVFYEKQKSKVWHQGYGAGFYFTPFRERFTIDLTLAFSKEEKGLILFGFGSNF
ncbi:MAG: hypothetical protein HKN76_16460, partial [Saprospiraceae bacterium]|nr:hypothetical protein [Saprospiraceae bacterium]